MVLNLMGLKQRGRGVINLMGLKERERVVALASGV